MEPARPAGSPSLNGARGIVGGIVGGVVGGVSALFGGPGYSYTPATGYGGPFAAPFNAAGGVAEAPFQVVGGAFGRNVLPPAPLTRPLSGTGARPAYLL